MQFGGLHGPDREYGMAEAAARLCRRKALDIVGERWFVSGEVVPLEEGVEVIQMTTGGVICPWEL